MNKVSESQCSQRLKLKDKAGTLMGMASTSRDTSFSLQGPLLEGYITVLWPHSELVDCMARW